MRNGSPRLLPWFAALMVAAASTAQAQQSTAPPNALQGFSQNRDQPVNIKAASLAVNDRDKLATFSGDVHLVQGDTTLRCKTLKVFFDTDQTTGGPAVKSASSGPTGSSQIRRMEAKGDVIVTQTDQTVTGEMAVYDMTESTVTLSSSGGGRVAVTQGPNVMRAPRLVVHLDTGVSHFIGGVQALINTNSTKRDNQRTPATDAKAAPAHQPPKAGAN